MDKHVNLVATVVIGMIIFIYTQITALSIAQARLQQMVELHQGWVLRLQTKIEKIDDRTNK